MHLSDLNTIVKEDKTDTAKTDEQKDYNSEFVEVISINTGKVKKLRFSKNFSIIDKINKEN